MLTAEEIIRKLSLKPLPGEGGFYRETYRSEEKIPMKGLPGRYSSAKSFCTAIYYLLTPDTCSALHRLSSDELFHFYLEDKRDETAIAHLEAWCDVCGQVFVCWGRCWPGVVRLLFRCQVVAGLAVDRSICILRVWRDWEPTSASDEVAWWPRQPG